MAKKDRVEAGRIVESGSRPAAGGGTIKLWIAAACLVATAGLASAQGYTQTNLVSDIPGEAKFTDPNLVNPWGMAFSGTSPIWVADNGTGLSTLYKGDGTINPLVVTIPPPSGGQPPAAPTGVIFNSNSGSFSADRFIFSTEDGTIAGWQSGANASLRVDNSGTGAVYKGLATGTAGGNNFLYATDFHNGAVDVFNSSYAMTSTFTDPGMAAGYAPFNIQNFGGMLYVTYAKQDAQAHDDDPGAGHGYLDVFDTNGNLVRRVISQGALNSPWGLAMAPGNFGQFSNDLLVGNFGDGHINAFDPTSGGFLGSISDPGNNPLTIDGLWGLDFGNGAQNAATNSLYFTAGIPGDGQVEDHGLFGHVDAVPEPSSFALLGLGLVGAAFLMRRK